MTLRTYKITDETTGKVKYMEKHKCHLAAEYYAQSFGGRESIKYPFNRSNRQERRFKFTDADNIEHKCVIGAVRDVR